MKTNPAEQFYDRISHAYALIGDMTPLMQTKILRVLQDQTFERVGGSGTVTSTARLIAATKIVAFADAESVDLIVIGTHGRTGLFRAFMGSVAESVVRHASCPVATFKHPKHKAEE